MNEASLDIFRFGPQPKVLFDRPALSRDPTEGIKCRFTFEPFRVDKKCQYSFDLVAVEA